MFAMADFNVTFKSDVNEMSVQFDGDDSVNLNFGEVQTVNVGENGATFTPSVSEDGVLSWTNDRELPNPEPVNIKGEKGDDGKDGYSPVRGVDYWTDADKAEIKSYVDEAILGGEW